MIWPATESAGALRPHEGWILVLAARAAPVTIGAAPVFLEALTAVQAAAKAPRRDEHGLAVPVLLRGERGVGKEHLACALHAWSDRAGGPFVRFDAAAVAPSLLTGALLGQDARLDLLELAAGGTLFVDEIEEVPVELQAELVRAVEGRSFRRTHADQSGDDVVPVDVRLVCATRGDLAQAAQAGRLRPDLHAHLHARQIAVPPLRERGGDVELLTDHLAAAICVRTGQAQPTFAPEAREALRAYPWPGNVRELRETIERALALCAGREVRVADLPRAVRAAGEGASEAITGGPESAPLVRLEDVIRRHVIEVFHGSRDNVTRTALALGISRVALRRRLREYGVKRPH